MQEFLALNQYLSLLDHQQVAFGVKQRNPEALNKAVSATLQFESYVPPRGEKTPTTYNNQ